MYALKKLFHCFWVLVNLPCYFKQYVILSLRAKFKKSQYINYFSLVLAASCAHPTQNRTIATGIWCQRLTKKRNQIFLCILGIFVKSWGLGGHMTYQIYDFTIFIDYFSTTFLTKK